MPGYMRLLVKLWFPGTGENSDNYQLGWTNQAIVA
jgi:hypothetical protein